MSTLQNQRKLMKSSGRKALQPRNIFVTPPPPSDTQFLKKTKAPPHDDDELQENLLLPVPVPVPVVQSMDASLAEELSAFKKKLERLRDDRERTEKLLEERGGAMGLQMSHLLQRGEIQKSLEIQVDRLFRLKELHAYSSKISPIRSLRAKEQEKRKRFSFEPEEESSAESEKIITACGLSSPPIQAHLDDSI